MGLVDHVMLALLRREHNALSHRVDAVTGPVMGDRRMSDTRHSEQFCSLPQRN